MLICRIQDHMPREEAILYAEHVFGAQSVQKMPDGNIILHVSDDARRRISTFLRVLHHHPTSNNLVPSIQNERLTCCDGAMIGVEAKTSA